jgi:hypothetical protein
MLKLAWDFTIHTSTHDAIWSVRIDALNGKFLENNDVISCSFDRNNTHSAENLPIEKIRECHLQTNFAFNDSSTKWIVPCNSF